MQPVAKPVNMKQRQAQQQVVFSGHLPDLDQVERVRREIAVRQHGPFGFACCAGGVDERGHGVAGEFIFGSSALSVFRGGRGGELRKILRPM